MFSNTKLPQGSVDRDAYVVCVLEQLHRALNQRDVFAAPSNRWADPRAGLLDGPRWEAMRTEPPGESGTCSGIRDQPGKGRPNGADDGLRRRGPNVGRCCPAFYRPE
ncbi:hypothetical protein GCM10020367_34530 [Streptomyces sannanensis]|uniref:Uncharacterized protein n=1 Tax=Streptomyces sannanensis TaxID=285536 RepID=A0ABP6SD65_9ACTN